MTDAKPKRARRTTEQRLEALKAEMALLELAKKKSTKTRIGRILHDLKQVQESEGTAAPWATEIGTAVNALTKAMNAIPIPVEQ